MKFAGQDKYGPVVLRQLRDFGPHTGRELAEALGLEPGLANKTVHRLADAGLAVPTGELRGIGKYRSKVFRWIPRMDLELPEPMLQGMEREVQLKENDRAINALRTSFVPGQFDPFRVLRAQVA